MNLLIFQESRLLLHLEEELHNKLSCPTLEYTVWGSIWSGCDQECKGCCSSDTKKMWVWSLYQEDPLEESMATHSSILVWRIPWTEEPGRLQSIGLQRVGLGWVTNTFTFHIIIHIRKYTINNPAIKFIDFTQILPFVPLMSFLWCKSQSRIMNCF